jgi:hypothetical protein
MVCPSCGRDIGYNEQYCKHCGFKSAVIYAEEGADGAPTVYVSAKKRRKKADGARYGWNWNSFTQARTAAPGVGYYQPLIPPARQKRGRGVERHLTPIYKGAAVVSLLIAAAALVLAVLGVFGTAFVSFAGAGLAVAAFIAAGVEKHKNFNYTYVGIALGIVALTVAACGIIIEIIL